ncbi:MAG: hypothetical protein V4710_02895 [Verrucomicrobiota bacterium]
MMIRSNLCVKRDSHEHRVTHWKRWACIGSVAVICLGLCGWGALQSRVKELRKTSARLRTQHESIGAQLAAARVRASQIAATATRRNAIVGMAKNRFNWAPLLARMFSIVPENMEFSSLSATCSNQNACRIEISGRVASEKPRLDCDKFRLLLINTLPELETAAGAQFLKLEDSEEKITVDQIPYSVSHFIIALNWNHRPHEK